MSTRKIFLLLITLFEWAALIAQFVLQLQGTQAPPAELTIRFFSYFTILTNLLVAVYTTVLLTGRSGIKPFFEQAGVQTAIALHIFIVGLVYNLLLRHLWTMGGLQAVLNEALHSVTPVMVIAYWWLWVNARTLRYTNVFTWLIYPAVYSLYTVLHGEFSAWYPYPFINVIKLGYPQAVINAGFVLLAFLLFGWLLVFLGKIKNTPNR